MNEEGSGRNNSIDKMVDNDDQITFPVGKNVKNINKSICRHFIGDVNVTTPSENIQLGSRVVINGPAIISGVKVEDVIWNRENCKCKVGKFENKPKLNVKIYPIKNGIVKNWNLQKCLLVGLTIISVEMVILYFCAISNPIKLDGYDITLAIHEINSKLPKFISREEDEWGSSHECTFYCSLIKDKTLVKFLMVKPIWWYCFEDKKYCIDSFEDEFNRNRNNTRYPFNDLYYNYVIGLRGEIFEGRFVNCPFDEEFLEKSHFSAVTIGIPYCFPGNSKVNKFYTVNVYEAIKQLLKILRRKNILVEDYVIEFPEICNNSLIFDLIIEGYDRLSFYNKEPFDVASDWNPEMMRTLLFLSEDNTAVSKVPEQTIGEYQNKSATPRSIPRCDRGIPLNEPCMIHLSSDDTKKNDAPRMRDKVNNTSTSDLPHQVSNQHFDSTTDSSKDRNSPYNHQPTITFTTSDLRNKTRYDSPNETSPNSDKNDKNLFKVPSVDRIKIRFTYMPAYYSLRCNEFKYCWNGIKEGVNSYAQKYAFKINYFIGFRFGGFVYKKRETIFSENVKKNVVNIGILSSDYSTKYYDPKDPIKSLSELLHPIIDDVKMRINYADVIIEFRCLSKFSEPKLTFHKIYEMLYDVKYSTKC